MDGVNRSTLLSSWSKEQTLLLLNELQKHPLIYDNTHPSYNIRTHRLVALQSIAIALKPFKPHMTPNLISNKIQILKSQYWKEKNYIKEWLENFKPGQEPYKPKLWCFDNLTFLDNKGTYDKICPHSDLTVVEDAEDIEDIIEECHDDEHNDSTVPFEEVEKCGEYENHENGNNYKQTSSLLQIKCLKLLEVLTTEVERAIDENISGATHQSPSTYLGLMIESELSKVPEEIYDDAKWKIIRVLEETSKKCRELQMLPVQNKLPLPSTSTSSSTSFYSVGGETQETLFDNDVFESPIEAPLGLEQITVVHWEDN